MEAVTVGLMGEAQASEEEGTEAAADLEEVEPRFIEVEIEEQQSSLLHP